MSTSDSVDRVFSHALATVRRLPRTGSSRPPPSARLRLYGLYKQSMEGDVEQILSRPQLPPPSPTQPADAQNGNGNGNGQDSAKNGNALNRYGSRDLRTREAQAEIEKWDAWHTCAGMSRTAAKKAYISTLIETMKEYASGTQESRELVSELEFVWGQISRSASGGSGSEGSNERRRSSNEEDGKEQESPRRAGLRQMDSFTSLPPGRRKESGDDNGGGRLRVLSPVGQSSGAGSDIVENEEVDPDEPSRPQPTRRASSRPARGVWQQGIEEHLRHLSTEIAALREQLSSQHLLSSSGLAGYSRYDFQNLSFTSRLLYRFSAWFRWALGLVVRQAVLQAVFVGVVIVYGRWRGDRRVESWVRQRLKEVWGLATTIKWERPRIPYL